MRRTNAVGFPDSWIHRRESRGPHSLPSPTWAPRAQRHQTQAGTESHPPVASKRDADEPGASASPRPTGRCCIRGRRRTARSARPAMGRGTPDLSCRVPRARARIRRRYASRQARGASHQPTSTTRPFDPEHGASGWDDLAPRRSGDFRRAPGAVRHDTGWDLPFLTLDSLDTGLLVTCSAALPEQRWPHPWRERGVAARISRNAVFTRARGVRSSPPDPPTRPSSRR